MPEPDNEAQKFRRANLPLPRFEAGEGTPARSGGVG